MKFICLMHSTFGLKGRIVEHEESERTRDLLARKIIAIYEEPKAVTYETKVVNKRSKKRDALNTGN